MRRRGFTVLELLVVGVIFLAVGVGGSYMFIGCLIDRHAAATATATAEQCAALLEESP